ncbi:hypothetical protein JCGZ_26630 [Jatropha curcas]|uniref:Uncharacterized protein n=1 Tax=Jatropha curcas TaxID=180498 RepID=A0A067JM54_JATCU|nr:hypothetical protein JCGZ_26630 [Jatropha curcas]
MARSSWRSKSMTVGVDGLDSRRWRSDRSEERLEPCPASPEEPIATFILLNSGRKREGEEEEGRRCSCVREEEEKKRKKREEKMGLESSGLFRFDLN